MCYKDENYFPVQAPQKSCMQEHCFLPSRVHGRGEEDCDPCLCEIQDQGVVPQP